MRPRRTNRPIPNTEFTQGSNHKKRNTHKDQRAIQVFVIFLDKVVVVIVGRTLELAVELDGWVAGRPEEARKESWQCLIQSVLQAENDGKGSD